MTAKKETTQRYDLRVTSPLFNKLQRIKNEQTISAVLHQCIDFAILHRVSIRSQARKEAEKTVSVLKKEKLPKNHKIDFRESMEKINVLKSFYKTENASLAIRCAIHDFMVYGNESEPIRSCDKLFFMTGQKNPFMVDWLTSIIGEVKTEYHLNRYVEPFTGTANVLLHLYGDAEEIINDNSELMVNLLRVLQKHPVALKLFLLRTPYTKELFFKYRKELSAYLKGTSSFRFKDLKKQDAIDLAGKFFVTRFASVFGKGESVRKVNSDAFRRKLDVISSISQRLQQVDIKKRDALYLCGLQSKYSNSLVYLDPPYLFSEYYYSLNNTDQRVFKSHQKLANLIHKLRADNVVLISYRITASKGMKNKGISDLTIQEKLEKLYGDQGYHVGFKLLPSTKNQIEILISSVPFTGSVPFSGKISDMDLVKDLQKEVDENGN